MARARHPRKEIEQALRYAEQHGWSVEIGGSHARQIKRVVDNCSRGKSLASVGREDPESE